jgi:butyryl-CoA dehydrogenase
MAVSAQNAIADTHSQYTGEFLKSKIHAMRFYFKYELPKTKALAEVLLNEEVLTVKTTTKIFAV